MSIYCKCIYAKNDINAEPKKCMFMQLKKKLIAMQMQKVDVHREMQKMMFMQKRNSG